eukprot:CAMPEP_0119537628 /NCGR_PEP_ID=MMETSP1344-20130328/50254_1 /TAXON_ID=236787 /ORGANISM="Florenciella parvula, Strain CCMP2471" /LENGTH=68 /DNA_ID=CAMNT_0007580201 /DNA_START=177 /DNA_END=380 /DNA_ORIENTATION=+
MPTQFLSRDTDASPMETLLSPNLDRKPPPRTLLPVPVNFSNQLLGFLRSSPPPRTARPASALLAALVG